MDESGMTGECGLEGEVSILSVVYPADRLGAVLLKGECIAYHDHRFGVSSGEHQIIIKVVQQENQLLVFYLHVPYAYPMPEGIRETIIDALVSATNLSPQAIVFINAGTESEKKDIHFRIELGGETR